MPQQPLIKVRIKLANGKKVTLGGIGPEKYQMYNWGKFAVATVKARAQAGIGSDDAPMKPLQGRYRFVKEKKGKGGVRNLTFTGAMLDNLSVRYADPTQARMDITSRHGRNAARSNERRTPWFGFSSKDTTAIFEEARRIFGPNLKNIGVRLRGASGVARNPIWANPAGINA